MIATEPQPETDAEPEPIMTRLSIYCPAALVRLLDLRARHEGRSQSAMAALILRRELTRWGKGRGRKA